MTEVSLIVMSIFTAICATNVVVIFWFNRSLERLNKERQELNNEWWKLARDIFGIDRIKKAREEDEQRK